MLKNKFSKFWVLGCLILLTLPSSWAAVVGEVPNDNSQDSPTDSTKQCSQDNADECAPHHFMHRPRLGIKFNPRYYRLKDENFAPAFSNNGFSTPSQDRFGFSFAIYLTTDSAWQVGVGFAGLSASDEPGSSLAHFSDNYGGIYFAKNFTQGHSYEITLGSLIGYGMSEVEILSGNQNGKFDEGAVVLEPTLGAAYNIAQYLKLGATFSYLFPFARSTSYKGQGLGLEDISVQGWSAGLQFVVSAY